MPTFYSDGTMIRDMRFRNNLSNRHQLLWAAWYNLSGQPHNAGRAIKRPCLGCRGGWNAQRVNPQSAAKAHPDKHTRHQTLKPRQTPPL